MLTLFFTEKKQINNYKDACSCNLEIFAKYFKYMLDNGFYLPASQFESMFIANTLTYEDIDKFLVANKKALLNLKK